MRRITFISSALLLCLAETLFAGIDTFLRFDPETWVQPAANGVKAEFRDRHLLLSVPKGTGSPDGKIELMLKTPRRVPEKTVRFGLWFHTGGKAGIADAAVRFRDAKGREFACRLPESRTPGWHYVDTFALGVAERGRMHSAVGTMRGEGDMIPVPPLELTGIDLVPKNPDAGTIALREITVDDTGRNPGIPRWGLSPDDSGTTPGIIWSGDAPFLPAGCLLPSGGKAKVKLEVWKPMEQGEKVAEKEVELDFSANDRNASFQRIPLGEFPRGNYTVTARITPSAPEAVRVPPAWNRLEYKAQGDVSREKGETPEGERFLRAVKKAGPDNVSYVGCRQWFPVPKPGKYRLAFLARTASGGARATVQPYDSAWKTLPGGGTVNLDRPVGQWRKFEKEVEFPEGTVRAFLDLVAYRQGEACFDGVSLVSPDRPDVNLIANGGVEADLPGIQKRFPLQVVYSPVGRGAFAGQSRIRGVSDTADIALELPEPFQKGLTRWNVRTTMGEELASGTLARRKEWKWTAPKPGAYLLHLDAVDGGVVADSADWCVGVKTPLPAGYDRGEQSENVPCDADFFGPGREYFTWGQYEFNFRRPGWVEQFKRWLEDGKNAGYTILRVRADWRFLEPLPGVFDWSLTDYALDFARRNRIKIMFELKTDPPEWFNCLQELDSFGRQDLGVHSTPRRTGSLWSPGILDGISNYVRQVAARYRNDTALAGYLVWGAPGHGDWSVLDKPHLGICTDYLPEAVAEFVKQSDGRWKDAPAPDFALSGIDLRDDWRDWIHFRTARLESFFLDHAIEIIRSIDRRRVIAAYNGLDYSSDRMAANARKNRWFRHSGGSHSSIQTPMRLWQEYNDSGHIMPSEVHYMTPTPWEYEQATYNIGHIGGAAFAWHTYWRENIRTGQWEKNRDEGLKQWRTLWRPLWTELRNCEAVTERGPAILTTWLSPAYLLDSIFYFRTMDFASKLAAAAYHDGCSPVFFTENADFKCLDGQKLVIVSEECAPVVNTRTENALAEYVRNGGMLVLFGKGGFYNMDAARKTGNLLRKLSAPGDLANRAAGEPVADNETGGYRARREPGTPVNTAFGPLVLTRARKGLHSPATDGGTVVRRWKYGKGEVCFFDGVPDWKESPGFLAAAARAAGIRQGTGSSARTVPVNHLAGGGKHYLIAHRIPAEFQVWLPAQFGFPNPEEKLAELPPAEVRIFVRNLPEGTWKIRERIHGTGIPGTFRTDALEKSGFPFRIGAGRTLVFELEPAD